MEQQLTVQNRRLKSKKNGYAQKYRYTVRGIRGVSPEEEKEGTVGRICRKGKSFKPGVKE